jgi:hypothetical protein
MKRTINIAGVLLGVVLALALSGLAASSASALPKGLCWKVEFNTDGNYTNYCLKEVNPGEGTYVLAELIEKQGVNLYCAKIDDNDAVGPDEGSKCEKLLSTFTGLYTTVLFGLPTFLLLTGEALPAELKGESKTSKTKLATKLGSLEGEGYLFQLYWTNLNTGTLGPASLLFTEVEEKTTKCHTTGDGTGLVLINNAEWHLVYILLDPLQVGFLFLIPQFTITCGAVSEKVKGSSLSTAAPLEKDVSTTEAFEGVSSCLSNLKPGVTKYWNDEGEEVTAKLEGELNGLGKFEEACENVEGAVKLKPTKMLEISQP